MTASNLYAPPTNPEQGKIHQRYSIPWYRNSEFYLATAVFLGRAVVLLIVILIAAGLLIAAFR